MSGVATFSSADVRGRRLYCWKTKPIVLLRRPASSSSSRSATGVPARRYVPLVGRSRQPMMFMRVVFPEPDGPTIATNSPSSTLMSTLRSACTSTDSVR
jgi:hypothetical protein